MRLIFAGTPEFARIALAQLHAEGFEIALVLTQPDRPAGRGMKLQASSVKQFSNGHGLPVAQPRSLRLDGKYPEDAAAARAALQAAQADAMVVAAYGLILPQWVLDLPRLGCFNIHASLLPRWRGAAPIHRAIEAGDSETGITLMQMDAGLDTGDMLLVERLAIQPHDTTGTLHDALAALGARLAVQALRLAQSGALEPQPQPQQGISYAHKIEKSESVIDWAQDAAAIERRIRAFNPFPGAVSLLGADKVKLWQAELPGGLTLQRNQAPGQIVRVGADGIDVATGDGVLRVTRLQKAGGKALDAAEWLRGQPVQPGMWFETAQEKTA